MKSMKKRAGSVMLAGALLLTVSACAADHGRGTESPHDICRAEPRDVYLALDGTASGAGERLTATRDVALNGALSQVVACGGRLRVTAFGGSVADSLTVFEGTLDVPGATQRARDRRLPKIVEERSTAISATFDDVATDLDADGSDIIGQLTAASEWMAEQQVDVLIVTDGFQNRQITFEEMLADPIGAAASLDVPDLPGMHVTFAGIGQTATDVPRTGITNAVKQFYLSVCESANAQSCRAVTDYRPSGDRGD